ncbi:MAG: hypothetical protein MZV63_24435 [Marinilabiliales bacterium]|nr:hypothetical protein [Marinilabiliales bacterium]
MWRVIGAVVAERLFDKAEACRVRRLRCPRVTGPVIIGTVLKKEGQEASSLTAVWTSLTVVPLELHGRDFRRPFGTDTVDSETDDRG